jgi:hypothetical protein
MSVVIGKVYTKALKGTSNGKPMTIPGHSYNVVDIVTIDGLKYYVTDKQYKPGVPLVIVSILVKKYVAYPAKKR